MIGIIASDNYWVICERINAENPETPGSMRPAYAHEFDTCNCL
jgi:hypothetical protein